MYPAMSLTPMDSPMGTPPGEQVVAAVRAAAEATGVSFEYLLAQATQESRMNPEAHNRRSSASGLFQFTSGTWLDMIKRHGAAHGLEDLAATIKRGADGRLHVANKDLRHSILDLRRDPRVSALMAAEYAKDNQKALQTRLGRPVSSSDLYLAHFLGAAGAIKVLRQLAASPKDDAAGLLPKAAQANAETFRESGGGAQSVAALYDSVQARFHKALGTALKSPAVQSELASLRPKPRPDEPQQIADLATDGVTPAMPAPKPVIAAAPLAPPTSYFPVPIPPPLSQPRADGVTMRGIIEAMDDEG